MCVLIYFHKYEIRVVQSVIKYPTTAMIRVRKLEKYFFFFFLTCINALIHVSFGQINKRIPIFVKYFPPLIKLIISTVVLLSFYNLNITYYKEFIGVFVIMGIQNYFPNYFSLHASFSNKDSSQQILQDFDLLIDYMQLMLGNQFQLSNFLTSFHKKFTKYLAFISLLVVLKFSSGHLHQVSLMIDVFFALSHIYNNL